MVKNKIAALDISKKRIGLVIYCFSTRSFLLERVLNKNFIGNLKKLYQTFSPHLTIVGLSTHPDGQLTQNGKFTKAFAHNLRDFIRPFQYIDEYLTTFEASLFEPEKKDLDLVAAKMILNRYLEKYDKENLII